MNQILLLYIYELPEKKQKDATYLGSNFRFGCFGDGGFYGRPRFDDALVPH
jgi:hypothetical protein